MKMIGVKDLTLQFDIDCKDEELERKVKDFINSINFGLARLFKTEAPQLLNFSNKINIVVEEYE